MLPPLRLAWVTKPPAFCFEPPVAGTRSVLAWSRYGAFGFHAETGAVRWRLPESDARVTLSWVERTLAGPVIHGRIDGRWAVVGLDPDGARRWRLPVSRAGALIARSEEGRGLWLLTPRKDAPMALRRLDLRGRVLGQWDALDEVTVVREHQGAVYFLGARDGEDGVYRLELSSGALERVWAGDAEELAFHSGLMFVSSREEPFCDLMAFDDRGSLRWRARANLPDFHHGRVLANVPGPSGATVACLDARSGETLWTSSRDHADRLSWVMGLGDLVCVDDGRLDALSLGDGALVQRLGTPRDGHWSARPCSVFRDRLVASVGDKLYCWERTT